MESTVQLTDEIRAKLEAAAKKDARGLSSIVQEALERYLQAEEERPGRTERALAALGTLDEEEADWLMEGVRPLRETWR